MTYRVDEILHESRTDHQHLALFRNQTFGRILALDGVIQTTERDEFIYHEQLTHLPILAHGAVRDVLIIGGGDGGTLEEVLKHPDIARAVMVEIDDGVVTFSKQYLSSICQGAFDDPRTELVIADGAAYVRETDRRFDLIIIDSTDPIGPGKVLFEHAFYEACAKILTPRGILITQGGNPFETSDTIKATLASFRRLFADAHVALATVPTYLLGPMAFGWGCHDPGVRGTDPATVAARLAATDLGLRYYTPDLHRAAFAWPGYLAEKLA